MYDPAKQAQHDESAAFARLTFAVHRELEAEAAAAPKAQGAPTASDVRAHHQRFIDAVEARWATRRDSCGTCQGIRQVVGSWAEGIKAFYADKE